MREDTRNRLFPVGLYAALLLGLFGVTFPQLVAPVEMVARTIVTLPLRAYSILLDAPPVLAADADASLSLDAIGTIPGQPAAVLRNVLGPPGHIPRVCRVVERRVGPLGVDELILDRSVRDLAGCPPLVTAGRDLLGFLVFDGDLPDADLPDAEIADGASRPDDAAGNRPARVRLLPYRRRIEKDERALRARSPFRPARIPAQVVCREVDAVDVLHFLVEPARPVDSWPLRCALLDDSYLGSRLRHSGDIVETSPTDDPLLPAGLRIGRLMIWGYPELEMPIPVGLFVEPMRDPRGISSVVVWEPADGGAGTRPRAAGSLLPVRFLRFPAPRPARERWMVTASSGVSLPDGAALVDGDRLLGVLQQPWSGQSLVTTLGASTRTWALLARGADGRVHEWVGQFVGLAARPNSAPGRGGSLRLRILSPRERPTPFSGDLFTGGNGRHCPAGLRIGQILPGQPFAESTDVSIDIPDKPIVAPQVFVGSPVDGGPEGPR